MAPRLSTPCTLRTPCTPRGTFVRGQACRPALSLTYQGAEKGMAIMDLLGCCFYPSLLFSFVGTFLTVPGKGTVCFT